MGKITRTDTSERRTHIPRAAPAITGLENPVLATPDVLVGLGGALVSTRLLLEVDVRVGETRNAHCDCAGCLCCLGCLSVFKRAQDFQREMVIVIKVSLMGWGKHVARELAWPSKVGIQYPGSLLFEISLLDSLSFYFEHKSMVE